MMAPILLRYQYIDRLIFLVLSLKKEAIGDDHVAKVQLEMCLRRFDTPYDIKRAHWHAKYTIQQLDITVITVVSPEIRSRDQ